jgi:hypothetical protein
MLVKSGLVLLLCLVLSCPAAEAEGEGGAQMGAKAVAPAICIFSSTLRALSASNMALGGGDSGATVAITQMVDEATALLKPATIDLAIRAVCNVPHNLTLSSLRGALVPADQTAEVAGPFLSEVRYRATARWGTRTATLIASGGAAAHSTSQDIGNAQRGDLGIEIRIGADDNDLTAPVMAGSYTDTIELSISARP